MSTEPSSTAPREGAAESRSQALLFSVAPLRLALPIEAVERVVRAVEVTPLPAAPAGGLGAVDVAGPVLGVIDLRQRLGLPPRDIAASDRFVIARAGARRVVLPVDEAEELIDAAALDAGDLCASSAAPLDGALRSNTGPVWICDLERFLSGDEAAALDRALAQAPAC